MKYRHAFSLIEVLVVIALLGMVLAVGSRVFVQVMRVSRDARNYEQDVAAIEHAMRLLRSDVWSAASLRVEGDGRLLMPGISWTAVAGRTEAGKPYTELHRNDVQPLTLNAIVTFALEGGVLLVQVDDRSVPMGSAMLIAETKR